jgi:hypothetical protein
MESNKTEIYSEINKNDVIAPIFRTQNNEWTNQGNLTRLLEFR